MYIYIMESLKYVRDLGCREKRTSVPLLCLAGTNKYLSYIDIILFYVSRTL